MQDKKKEEESARQMQLDNATGSNNGEQGQASFTTGSTTQGGSNFGQGSSQLGGETYRQGDASNDGANYKNEEGRLGDSSIGTNEEGSSAPRTGAVGGADYGQGSSGMTGGSTAQVSDTGREKERERGDEKKERPEEGDRKDTGLEDDSHLGQKRNEGRSSGSWSKGTL